MRKIPLLTKPTEEQIVDAMEVIIDSGADNMPGNGVVYFASHAVALTDALTAERTQTAQLRALLNHVIEEWKASLVSNAELKTQNEALLKEPPPYAN